MDEVNEVEWTEEAEETLVNLWRNEPCLYDINTKNYSNKHMKQKKFEEFGAIVGKSDAEVKKHLNSLRTQFIRYRKALPSGSAAKKRTARQQWGLEQCSWLMPYMKQRTSQSTLDVLDECDEKLEDPVEILQSITQTESEPPSPKVPELTNKPTPKASKQKKEIENEELQIMKNLSSVFKQDDDKVVVDKTDEDFVFGRYIESEMKLIKNRKTKQY